jgi:Protein of unknown function (DUF3365)
VNAQNDVSTALRVGRRRGATTLCIIAAALAPLVHGCDGGGAPAASVSPQTMTDALHAVMAADREVYASEVVDRLQDQEKVIKATQHFKEDKSLPLPAQMFRMGAEMGQKNDIGFTYSLLSPWPINKQNGPKTELEKMGLRTVTETGKNYYTEESLGGKRYFSAFYPDKAVAETCVTCHNAHQDSPRKDFKAGDVIGGIVIRVPLER